MNQTKLIGRPSKIKVNEGEMGDNFAVPWEILVISRSSDILVLCDYGILSRLPLSQLG